MMGEVPNVFAAEQLAASLIPSPGGSAAATWAARSRTLLTAILRRGRQSGISTHDVYRRFAVADRTELRNMLAGTAAEPFLAEGATRLLDSVRSSSVDAMSALEHAPDRNDLPFSLTQWASDTNDSTNQGDSPGGKSCGSSLSAHIEAAVMPSQIKRCPIFPAA